MTYSCAPPYGGRNSSHKSGSWSRRFLPHMASLSPLCQTTGHSIAKRPFDSLLKHTISYKLPVRRNTPRRMAKSKEPFYSRSELIIGRRLQTQLPTLPPNLYPHVQIKERQLEHRTGKTPRTPLCLSSSSKTSWSRTTPSYAGLWCQSCRANTCHSCIASAQQSVGPQATQVPPSPRTAVPVVTTGNNTGWVRTFTESKPCSPDNLVRKNCETRTLESLVEHWIVCVSALHMNILICCYYSRCCWFSVLRWKADEFPTPELLRGHFLVLLWKKKETNTQAKIAEYEVAESSWIRVVQFNVMLFISVNRMPTASIW